MPRSSSESDEGNNCRASAAVVTVALPDLVQHTVSNLGGPFRRGTAFTVSDTVRNDAQRGHAEVGDDAVLPLDGRRPGARATRCSPASAPSRSSRPAAGSSASVTVMIPSTTLPGTYVVLACADDTKLVAESSDANNCRASGTAVVVTP